MEEYYVSLGKSPWRDIGSICKRVGKNQYDYIGNKDRRYATTGSFDNHSDWIPASLQEIVAYTSGIGNVKDMIINDLNIIEIW